MVYGAPTHCVCSLALHNPVRYAYDVGQALGCPSLLQLAQTLVASLGPVRKILCTGCAFPFADLVT